eukprot:11928706-Heterocapsa_arctica.AAC.1
MREEKSLVPQVRPSNVIAYQHEAAGLKIRMTIHSSPFHPCGCRDAQRGPGWLSEAVLLEDGDEARRR